MTREETNVGGKMLFLLYHNWTEGLGTLFARNGGAIVCFTLNARITTA